jgi:COMPASS component SPP1
VLGRRAASVPPPSCCSAAGWWCQRPARRCPGCNFAPPSPLPLFASPLPTLPSRLSRASMNSPDHDVRQVDTGTMSSIDSLLNHDANQGDQQTRPEHLIAPTTYDAADALATLATLGSGQQYASRELPSPTASAPPPRRSSSFSSHAAAPVEPSPPIEQPQAHSPTLEQYHHGSNSPEAQRRQSLALARSSPAPMLAPIQSLSAGPQDEMSEPPAAHGHDASRVLSSPSSLGEHARRDETQDREPALVRDEPTTSQIRVPGSPHKTSDLPAPKHEPSDGPQEGSSPAVPTPSAEHRQSVTSDTMDADTLKAIEIAKKSDLGLRAKHNTSVAESVTSPTDQSKPGPSKKRPAPSGASAIRKKGTATAKKPPSKKRRLDTEADGHTRSVTPSSRAAKSRSGKKGSQAGTPVAGSSPAPDHSSQVHPTDDEGDSSEDTALYCICRKPDNHRWMIGCDGGCDDWFHGSCVNMEQADEDLVDRFICPLCQENGRGETTWKPMCRRDGCRKPARTTKGKESKYCSEECGTLFMSEQVQRTAGAKAPKRKSKKKGGKNGEEPASEDDEEPTPLGGVLRAKDLKALIDQAKDIQTFKGLGSGVLSPPRTASPTKASFDSANGTARPTDDGLALTLSETERLNALHKEKLQLKDRLEVLKDREKFVSLVKDQVTRIAEREKVKAKELCGYDSRLAWSDGQFLTWRNSRIGKASFSFMTLAPTPDQLTGFPPADGEDADMPMSEEQTAESVCLKKRCQKHPQWQKQNLQDARFEEVEIAEAIRECEKDERSVRERALRRGAKDKMARELRVGDADSGERNAEGWVEVVKT